MSHLRLYHAVLLALYAGINCLVPRAAYGLPGRADKLVKVAGDILDEGMVSYVFGGSEPGDPQSCSECNVCLNSSQPKPKERLRQCPICAKCSLDCSHFTALVFRTAGLPYPYLDTKTMLSLSGEGLLRRYSLVDIGDDPSRSVPGDLLVYDGHVVMLERRHGKGCCQGDVIHATGGKDIKGPGAGIQRERFIDISQFRGVLRRVLRHKEMVKADALPRRLPVLRPVERRSSDEDG